MNFFFRADSSSQIGSGHVQRCLTLAKKLKESGNTCKFICRNHKNNLIQKILKENFEVIKLPNSNKIKFKKKSINKKTNYLNWIGASWKEDAQQTINILKKEKVDWLVVDHYGIDYKWEQKLRSYSKKIMVIDDLANRKHDCDLLLDQNLIANFKNRYKNLLPKNCSTLIGPEFALLQDDYKDLHLSIPPRKGPVKRILVYFGATDEKKLTEKTLLAFLQLNKKDIILDVVLSPESPQIKNVKKLTNKFRNINLHIELKSLANLILKADLAVGACGSTSWERCCLGLPSIVVTIADNQEPIAKELHLKGVVRWLGHCDNITKNLIYNELKSFINQNLEAWSDACKLVTDGHGTRKVTSFLTLESSTVLTPRKAQLTDEDFFLSCVGYEIGKSAKKTQEKFLQYLRNHEKYRIYIIQIDSNLPICTVQFTLTKDGWAINAKQLQFIKHFKLKKIFIESAIYQLKLDENNSIKIASKIKNKINIKSKLSISICSEKKSWINSFIPFLIYKWTSEGYACFWTHNSDCLVKGDICFYLSYGKIVEKQILKKFKNNLVVHESDLPNGKGWSPLTWQILEKKKNIPFTLIEAEEKVDSGVIYKQKWHKFNGYELLPELHRVQSKITNELCTWFVNNYPHCLLKARKQRGRSTMFNRRYPHHSKLDVNLSIKDQFNLLRVVDNKDYPAYFEFGKNIYNLKITSKYKI
jgi:UDP-2,4-diacetamido-2,4,6-trideoxy-beta-L-altropyranose hydrolase